MNKSPFYDFLNRRAEGLEAFLETAIEDVDFIDWNGFVLPDDYGGSLSEYAAIREQCALFDGSPFRKIRARGDGAGPFFDRLLTRPVSSMPSMRATYTVYCNDDGTLKDDGILYKLADDDYLMMPSDIDHSPYYRQIAERFEIADVAFEECSGSLAGLAIQGPMAARALLAMGFDDIEQMAPFEARHYAMSDGEALISRTGFTADLGYECWVAPEQVGELTGLIERARSQLSIAIPGYGLAAVQACRLEGGFIVAGWDCATELDPQPGLERSPYELGMDWQVKLDDRDFVGREALRAQREIGCKHLFRYFQADIKRPPDDGARIMLKGSDEVIGMVTSSAYSPGLDKVIGNATVRGDCEEIAEAAIVVEDSHVTVRLGRDTHVDFERRARTPAPS